MGEVAISDMVCDPEEVVCVGKVDHSRNSVGQAASEFLCGFFRSSSGKTLPAITVSDSAYPLFVHDAVGHVHRAADWFLVFEKARDAIA
jgi:hypothetical protein